MNCKSLQKPRIINYTQQEFEEEYEALAESKETQEREEDVNIHVDRTLATNTDTNNTDGTMSDNNTNINTYARGSTSTVSIVPGSGNPDSKEIYGPYNAKVRPPTTITRQTMVPYPIQQRLRLR